MAMQISDPAFGAQALNALEAAVQNISIQVELGILDPQEAVNLTAKFLNLQSQVHRATADAIDQEVGKIFVQPFLWGDVA